MVSSWVKRRRIEPIRIAAKAWPTEADSRAALPAVAVTFDAAARAIRAPSSGNAGTRTKTSSSIGGDEGEP